MLAAGSPISATCTDSGSGGEFDNVGASCVAVCAGVLLVPLRTLSAPARLIAQFGSVYALASIDIWNTYDRRFSVCCSLPCRRSQHGIAFR